MSNSDMRVVGQVFATITAVIAFVAFSILGMPQVGLAVATLMYEGTMMATNALFPVPGPGRMQAVREPIASHKIIYGQVKVGGAVTFIDSPRVPGDNQNESLAIVVTVSGHPIEAIDALYINDTYVPLGADGWALKAPVLPDGTQPTNYTGKLQAYKGLGTVAGDAGLIAALVAQAPKWGSDFFQYSRGKLYVRLGWDNNLFGSTGVPNIACVIRGRRIYDPRNTGVAIASSNTAGLFTTSGAHGLVAGSMVFVKNHTGAVPASPQPFWPQAQRNKVAQEYEVASVPSANTFTLYDISHNTLTLSHGGSGGTVTEMTWTDNSVLATYDYLIEPVHGMGVIYDSEVDENLLITGANVCDEIEPRAAPVTTFTANPADSQITYAFDPVMGAIPTLSQVILTTTGSLPGGLDPDRLYYYAQIGGGPIGGLSTNVQDAAKFPPVCVHISSVGVGTHSITLVESVTPATAGGTTSTTLLDVFNHSLRISTGDEVVLNNIGGAPPAGLSTGVNYFAIMFSDSIVGLATTLVNARLGIPITFSGTGSGVTFIKVLAEPRYTANGQANTQEVRQSILQRLLMSSGGRMVPSGVLINVYPAHYLTPTVTLNESDMRGPLQVQTLQSGGDSFNSVKGTFVDIFNKGQVTDYPQLQNMDYIAQDNGEVVWRELPFDFTNSSSMAQRLAKIELERNRRELSVNAALKLTAFQVGSPDTVMFDNVFLGWVGETFEVQSWQFSIGGDKSNPTLDVNITGRQTDPAIYAWTKEEEAAAKRQTNTNLPNPFVVSPPSSLTLQSGGALLVQQTDGTIVSRIEVSCTSPVDQFVLNGGFIEVVYSPAGANNWQSAATVPGDQTFAFIENAAIGASYDIAARARNAIGGVSDTDHPWQSEIDGYVVLGKTNAPSNIATIAVSEDGMTVNLQGSPITDTDVVSYEYRYNASNSWTGATVIGQAAAVPNGSGGFAGAYTTNKVPVGTYWFLVKALNRSGIYSVTAASSQSTITGTISGADISPGTMTDVAFASGIKPVYVYSSLPGSGAYIGQVVTLSTTGVLYRWNGSAWTLDVPAVAITGLLTDAQLAAIAAAKITGQLTDAQLAAIAAAKVTGQLTDSQIAALAAAKLTGQITTTQIGPNSVTTAKLAAGSVTTNEIAASTIVAGNIASGAITTAKITAGAVTTNEIAASTIVAGNIAASTITGTQIAASTIAAANIVANTITAGQIAAATITATQIAATTILGSNIAANTLTSGTIASNAITAGAIAAGAINASAIIVSNIIITGHITANAITNSNVSVGGSSTVGTSFATLTSITFTTTGGNVLLQFTDYVDTSTAPMLYYRVTRDGSVISGTVQAGGGTCPTDLMMSGTFLDVAPSAASHVYALQAQRIGGSPCSSFLPVLVATELKR